MWLGCQERAMFSSCTTSCILPTKLQLRSSNCHSHSWILMSTPKIYWWAIGRNWKALITEEAKSESVPCWDTIWANMPWLPPLSNREVKKRWNHVKLHTPRNYELHAQACTLLKTAIQVGCVYIHTQLSIKMRISSPLSMGLVVNNFVILNFESSPNAVTV